MLRRRKAGRGSPPAPATIFAALGDPRRLGLVTKLAEGRPCSISELAEGSRISRQAITKHLQVLQKAGLVSAQRKGRERQFQFETAQLQEAKAFLDAVSAHWDQALARLQAFVEAE